MSVTNGVRVLHSQDLSLTLDPTDPTNIPPQQAQERADGAVEMSTSNAMGARQRSAGVLREASDKEITPTGGIPAHTSLLMPDGQAPDRFARWWTWPGTILDLVSVVCIVLIYGLLEKANMKTGYMVFEHMYSHSYPYKENTVPTWTVPVYSIGAPLIAFLIWKFAEHRRTVIWYDVYKTFIACLFAIFLTSAITNGLKVAISRPRPNFYYKCWPLGTKAVYTAATDFGGYPVCVDEVEIQEFLKSFPSGHASFSAAGLGFLTFWLLGQTQACVKGHARAWAFFISVVPAIGALCVGVSRITDYWHNVSDVCFGLALGFWIAFVAYIMVYPFFISHVCHVPRHHLVYVPKPQNPTDE